MWGARFRGQTLGPHFILLLKVKTLFREVQPNTRNIARNNAREFYYVQADSLSL